jgi:hypothetical protein
MEAAMTERPILFSAPMVNALLAGTKTQTRRAVKPQTAVLTDEQARAFGVRPPAQENAPVVPCPYGVVGDRLWVKETWKADQIWDGIRPVEIHEGEPLLYTADEHATGVVTFEWGRGRPSIFMRHWMSRITLELTAVRVERLNQISEADAQAEGVDGCFVWKGEVPSRVSLYQRLWEQINGAGSWAANPWVWALTFRRVGA